MHDWAIVVVAMNDEVGAFSANKIMCAIAWNVSNERTVGIYVSCAGVTPIELSHAVSVYGEDKFNVVVPKGMKH